MVGAVDGRGARRSVSRRAHYGCGLAGLSVAVAAALFGRLAALAEGLGVVGPVAPVALTAFWWGAGGSRSSRRSSGRGPSKAGRRRRFGIDPRSVARKELIRAKRLSRRTGNNSTESS